MGKWFTGIILILVASLNSPGCASNDQSDPSKKSPVEASDRAVGSDAHLYLEGRNAIMVAVDEKAFTELINALSSSDAAVDALVQSGRVFTVPNKTRVRILEISGPLNKVRIIEGERIMQEGWVHELWVR